MRFRHAIERFRSPDASLSRDLRRLSAVAVLVSLGGAVMLFLLYALAASAPHPLSLFLGDVVFLAPLLFRVLAAAAAMVIGVLSCLRLYVHFAVRKSAR